MDTTVEKINYALLKWTIGDVELTPEEERSLMWLATWEPETVNNIVSAFQKGFKMQLDLCKQTV